MAQFLFQYHFNNFDHIYIFVLSFVTVLQLPEQNSLCCQFNIS